MEWPGHPLFGGRHRWVGGSAGVGSLREFGWVPAAALTPEALAAAFDASTRTHAVCAVALDGPRGVTSPWLRRTSRRTSASQPPQEGCTMRSSAMLPAPNPLYTGEPFSLGDAPAERLEGSGHPPE